MMILVAVLMKHFLTLTELYFFQHQLTLDLMNIDANAFSPYSNTMPEESCFTTTRNNNETSIYRLIGHKKKFVAFFTGDLDAASKMYELCQEYPVESGGGLAILKTYNFVKLVSVSSFLPFLQVDL